MNKLPLKPFSVRRAELEEYEPLGRMTVQAYEQLPGMPGTQDQPDYYAMLLDVAGRAATPTIDILVAVTHDGELLGGVTYVGDVRYYASGGSAGSLSDTSGMRLLAVKPEARGRGVGRTLTEACIRRARERGSRQIILHTTLAMKKAWDLYTHMGFARSPDLDFMQGELAVFGFRMGLEHR